MRAGKIDSIHIARITKNIDHISGMTLMDLYLEKKISPEEYQALWEVINEKSMQFFKETLAIMDSTERMNYAPMVKNLKDKIEQLKNWP